MSFRTLVEMLARGENRALRVSSSDQEKDATTFLVLWCVCERTTPQKISGQDGLEHSNLVEIRGFCMLGTSGSTEQQRLLA